MTKARQGRLRFGSVADSFVDQNRKVAELILEADPNATGLAADWARAVLRKAEPERPENGVVRSEGPCV